ncbi:DUF2798 domain-containing protein [Tropicimonas marinistellae]|uniref:DUF2798 domain-containing protein n=1 Tax=Tropicimonas marinistellae TaxID=1739787 RepID=UPI00098F797E|nr:DUF2798 domain-containing protein [Tropicimonas marinistellae]
MNDKLTLIVAQAIISFLMALTMTWIFSALPGGFGPGWVQTWLIRFVMAWPVAFLLSLVVGPVSFFLAAKATGALNQSSAPAACPQCGTPAEA